VPEYDTGLDILSNMLSRAGELDVGLAELETEAKLYVNRGYFGLIRLFPWLWAEAYPPVQFTTLPMIRLTGVNVTFTGISVSCNESILPYRHPLKLVIDVNGAPLRVVGYTGSPTVFTLSTEWLFDNVVNGTGFVYCDEYQINDILIPTGLRNLMPGVGRPNIAIIGRSELDAIVPAIPRAGGGIVYASFLTETMLRVAPWVTQPQLLEMSGTRRPAPLDFTGDSITDVPIVPIDERWIICDYGLYFLLQDHGDTRAGEVAQTASGRIGEIRDRQLAKMKHRVWVPEAFNPGIQYGL
jgi:hypothetical protein